MRLNNFTQILSIFSFKTMNITLKLTRRVIWLSTLQLERVWPPLIPHHVHLFGGCTGLYQNSKMILLALWHPHTLSSHITTSYLIECSWENLKKALFIGASLSELHTGGSQWTVTRLSCTWKSMEKSMESLPSRAWISLCMWHLMQCLKASIYKPQEIYLFCRTPGPTAC